MKRILMIAYHFPPLAGSSGIQRTLRFVQHLPQFGWEPLVLTTHPRAYERTSPDLLADIPADTVVVRAFALDTAKQLAIAGRYPGFLARPDRWTTWQFDGIRKGMDLIRQYRPEVIWSTYPIATAHLIGAELQRRTGLPWITDFRDPMAQDDYPTDPKTWQQFKRIEEHAMQRATLTLFTTPGAAKMYRQRYPNAHARIEVLENGYDEETFVKAEAKLIERTPLNPGHFTLLHSGIVYPSERDPSAFFEALGRIRQSQPEVAKKLKVRLRATAHDDLLRALTNEHDIEKIIEILPAIPYREALSEMLRADGLLILQAANCNNQIPAKLYEYVRANRPILALTPATGDTGTTLANMGIKAIAPLDDSTAIETQLLSIVRAPQSSLPNHIGIANSSRQARSSQLASLLNGLSAQRAPIADIG